MNLNFVGLKNSLGLPYGSQYFMYGSVVFSNVAFFPYPDLSDGSISESLIDFAAIPRQSKCNGFPVALEAGFLFIFFHAATYATVPRKCYTGHPWNQTPGFLV